MWRAVKRMTAGLVLAGCTAGGAGLPGVPAPAGRERPAAAVYRVYVANESADAVSRVAFTPGQGAVVEARTPVGLMITDIDGPHGLVVSPDARFWYVSLGHGTPFGRVAKYAAGADTLVGRVELGLFPASMALTPDGEFLYVVNFNLHGDMVPSSVSIVHAPTLREVARPTTCVMPHGSRVTADGRRQYSVCMMSEQLVAIDTHALEVTARFHLGPGHEGPLAADDVEAQGMQHGGAGACSPTWAQPGLGRWAQHVYVPCNASGEVLEIDMAAQRVTRRWAPGGGPYNVAVTPDGNRLITTLKGGAAVTVVDLATGGELARVPTSRPVTHGVVVSPDGRYAFISNESIGSARGTLDVLDLRTLEVVATVELEYQPTGLDFWTMTPAAR